MMTVGERIKSARDAAGMTQAVSVRSYASARSFWIGAIRCRDIKIERSGGNHCALPKSGTHIHTQGVVSFYTPPCNLATPKFRNNRRITKEVVIAMKKNAKGLYETSRVINGKRVKFRSKTLRGLDAKIAAYAEKAAAGRDFPTVAWEWLAEHERGVSANTQRIYRFALEALTSRFTGPIKGIKPLDIKRYFADRVGQGYAKKTLGLELTAMRQVCSYAVLAGDIDISPATEVKLPRGLPQKVRTALTAEQERLVAEYRGEGYLLGLFLLYTGMRRGELLALNWQDIDRANGVIHVTKKWDGKLCRIDNHLKSENGKRDIPLLKPLADALGGMDRLGRVFPINSETEFARVWRSYCDRLGLYDEITTNDVRTQRTYPITPHCFRHSFATVCYEAGCDARTTAAFLGDTVQTTEAVYVELRAAHHATGAERVNAYLELRDAERARA